MTAMDKANIEAELDDLKRSEQINEWHITLGYGAAEYTVDFNIKTNPNIKAFAKRLNQKYGAKDFGKYQEGSTVSVKFVVSL